MATRYLRLDLHCPVDPELQVTTYRMFPPMLSKRFSILLNDQKNNLTKMYFVLLISILIFIFQRTI